MHKKVFVILWAVLSGTASLLPSGTALAAPCAAPAADYGSVTSTVTINATGTYRVWSRIMAPDTTNNSYLLEIDGTVCYTVGDSAIAAGTWTWVDYQAATPANKINHTFSSTGSHTVKMIGNEPSVSLDRVVFTADMACVPSGTGDNCASPLDTTPPTVAITSPANNSTQTGTIAVNATASDDSGTVSKVEFYVDNNTTPTATDISQPFSFSLNTATLSVGTHTLKAVAYDAANNSAASTLVTINVQAPPDTTAPTVSITAPTNNSTQTGTIAVNATAADNIGVAKVEFYVDGSINGSADTTAPYSISLDTTKLTNASHTLAAKAYDAANNSTTSPPITINVNNPITPPPDTTPPAVSITNPVAGATLSGTYTVSANATDTSGIKQVDFKVDGVTKSTDATAPYNFLLDTTTLANGAHSFTATATDNSANVNAATSAAISATVSNVTAIPEDINQDGRVTLLDFSVLASKFGQTGSNLGRADINGDGTVNLLDFSRLASKFGT